MAFLSVVIPVYKAEKCLHELYSRLVIVLEKITSDYEIIMVEDCGPDDSWRIILELSKQNPKLKALQFSRNFGQHYGITAGLDYCTGDWAVVMDCDLQDKPEEIINLYQKALEGYDVVIAKPDKRKDKFLKRFTSQVFNKIFTYLTGINNEGQVGNFRILSKKVVMNFRLMREQLRFFNGLMGWMGFPTTSIIVEHAPRHSGKSSYTIKKLLKLATDGIIAYSDKPLRLSITLGFIMASVSFLYGIFFLFKAIFRSSPIPGWSSLIVSLFFLGGIIISILGVIGLYLGKNFDESKKRPLYIISKTTNLGEI